MDNNKDYENQITRVRENHNETILQKDDKIKILEKEAQSSILKLNMSHAEEMEFKNKKITDLEEHVCELGNKIEEQK